MATTTNSGVSIGVNSGSGGGGATGLVDDGGNITVVNYAALPDAAANNGKLAWVLTTTGTLFVNRKISGWYVSDGATWLPAEVATDEDSEIGTDPTGRSNTTGVTVEAALDELDAAITALASAGVPSGDKGDIIVSGGTRWTIDPTVLTDLGRQICSADTTAKVQDRIGGTTLGKALFQVGSTAAAQNLLEAGTVGLQVFKTATTAATLNALGGTGIGKGLFEATNTAAAQNLLEAGTVGLLVFKTGTTAAALNALGGTTIGKGLFESANTAAAKNLLDLSGTNTGDASSNTFIRAVGITIDGAGTVFATGSKGYITVPYNGTIANYFMAADQSGSVVVDVKRSGSSIVGGGGNKPTLTSAISSNASCASWTSNAITAGDIIEFNVDSVTSCKRVNLVLKVTVV